MSKAFIRDSVDVQHHKANNFVRGLIRLMRFHHVKRISVCAEGEIVVTGEDFGCNLESVESSGEVPEGISIEGRTFDYKHTL